MPRLSALSRGTGETAEPASSRISIRLDQSDISGGPRRRPSGFILKSAQSLSSNYMPPPGFFQPNYPRLKREASLPRTFSTKKGALVLYSEDLAQYHHQTFQARDVGFEMDRQQLDIKTTDLTVAISRFEQSRNKYNRFVRTGNVAEIKPGHSARRHIAAWHLSHPEVNIRGALGTTFSRKPDKRGRKQRIIKTSLTVFPPPYNLPKSLNQIKHGVTTNNVPMKEVHVHTHSDSLAASWTPTKKLAPIDSNVNTKERTATPQADKDIGQASTVSSEVNFTRKPLPPIFKNPSSEGSKVTKEGSQRTSSGSTIRKRVRIQLEPVVVPDGSPLPFDTLTR